MPNNDTITKHFLPSELDETHWCSEENDAIYLAGLMARSLAPPAKPVAGPGARCFTRPTVGDITAIAETFSILDDATVSAWRKLPQARLYSVHYTASPEWESPMFGEKEIRNNWVFGCSGGIGWQRRLTASGATWHENQVCFATDAAQENFESLYALELDEQSHEVQDMGFHVVEPFGEPERWLASLELGTKSW